MPPKENITKEDLKAALKELLLSQTIAMHDHSEDIAEIKMNCRLMNETLSTGKERFAKIDKCIGELTKLSQKQDVDISLLKQTQNNCKESKKSIAAVVIAIIALVINAAWQIIRGSTK